ncbi:hypothetical protein L1987_05701 [Smallanthus sonchifolius]|uniref:Uncharacterized protein n=1 Tax=Smallanthus sonchifolius TaxID=185202 RepID=A0ACB9JW32_9ASTR|nr:hypothetical protein L1987_05701 [Smallanthus sonchifolius]
MVASVRASRRWRLMYEIHDEGGGSRRHDDGSGEYSMAVELSGHSGSWRLESIVARVSPVMKVHGGSECYGNPTNGG